MNQIGKDKLYKRKLREYSEANEALKAENEALKAENEKMKKKGTRKKALDMPVE